MPHNLPFLTTGIPEILYFVISSHASPIVWSGSIVIGSTIIPLSERFTLSTSSACFSIDMFLWINPRPPTWAIAIASFASVTVSIAAETIGIFNVIELVSLVAVITSDGKISEYAGATSTSSKVSASPKNLFS